MPETLSPQATLPYPLPGVQQSSAASGTIHWHVLSRGDAQSVPFLVLTEHPGDTVSGTPIMLDQIGISHVSFTVPNVEAVTQRLLAQGVQTCGPADAFRDAQGHLRTVFFRDPDGILVQFDEGGEG